MSVNPARNSFFTLKRTKTINCRADGLTLNADADTSNGFLQQKIVREDKLARNTAGTEYFFRIRVIFFGGSTRSAPRYFDAELNLLVIGVKLRKNSGGVRRFVFGKATV